jgi:hypothetical protein
VRVLRDGVELGVASLGTPLPVDPGKHTVTVEATGRSARSFEATLREGESKTLEVEPGPALVDGGSPKLPGEVKRTPTLGYVLGGVGLAGLVVGGVSGALVLGKKSIADDNCPAQRCNQTGYDAVESGRTLSMVSTTGFIVGAVGVGLGAYFILSAGSGESAPPRAALSAAPLPGGAALSWFGSF